MFNERFSPGHSHLAVNPENQPSILDGGHPGKWGQQTHLYLPNNDSTVQNNHKERTLQVTQTQNGK